MNPAGDKGGNATVLKVDLALSVILIGAHPTDARGTNLFDGAVDPVEH